MKMNKELLSMAHKDLGGDINKAMTGGKTDGYLYYQANGTVSKYILLNCNFIDHEEVDYICTAEEFKNYKPEEEPLELDLVIVEPEVKPQCATKVKLHKLALENKEQRDTIKATEKFMQECGVLSAWNDNKAKYL